MKLIHNSIEGLDYCGLNNKFVISKVLNSWEFLRSFKQRCLLFNRHLISGIYQFVFGSDSYIGSSKDIFSRCFLQHKNKALTKPNLHNKFYSAVVKNGWDQWTLNIICITPNHVNEFSEQFPDYILTEEDIDILEDLNYYELTVAEQLNLDYYKPTLNTSLLANWSSYNIGASGYVKTPEANDKFSLSFLNRSYTEDTKNLHKVNKTGTKLSDSTKIKMSKSHGGVTVKLLDLNTNEIV